ncbi:hypothetical protein N2K95_13535 [Arthrobacter zhaoxinii]|uniref:Uncharacterized protein n=1 Tax=Arthrobacter zhaoxinii TaxID=2964616 RepID=A0ABY5YNJ0_9MICC|nr:hypothetical protein [Arthrobacter zhaoxinii]UWX96655.1 hypothetical protein N2K95_13535 [Arthrobacter zhaoxinii]
MSTPENTPEPGRDPNYPNNPQVPGRSGAPGGPPVPGGSGAPGGPADPAPRPVPQYGQYAPGPYASGQASYPTPPPVNPAKGAPPREVVTGSWLIIAAGVLSLINNVITSFSLPSLLTSQEQQTFNDAGLDERSMTTFLIAFGIVVALISFGIYVLIALFVRRGKNWARILGTVFAAFSLIGIFTMLGAYFTSPLSLISLASSLLGIAGIVMLYLQPSNPYFRKAPLYPY